MAYRFTIIVVLLVLAFTYLGFHLYQLQLVKGGYYYAQAESEQSAAQSNNANRGAIYFTDDNGNTLPAAIDQEFPIIYAVPTAVKDPATTAATFAPILNMPVSSLQAIFSRPNDQYELLINKADPAVAQKVTDLNIPGVYTEFEPERYYPLSTVASQVLGFVGPNASNTGESGKYGLEKYYNDLLEGSSSSNSAGGSDLITTIDPNIQIEAEKILGGLVSSTGATGGDVIVMDPKTGKILAMGGTPSFDPNNYSQSPLANFLNTDIQGVYEPGSIMKLLTMAAGIDSGKITPDTTYDDKGYVNVDGAHITNYNLTTEGAYGAGTTMTQVIEHSINSGAIWAENATGNSIFLSYAKKFGLDEKTGIDLPGEVAGNLSQLTPNAPQVDWDTAAYGQGIAMTPIELVSAVSAIANGGILMRPYINAALSPEEIRRVISTSTAVQVTQMAVDAVDLAQVAEINGYTMAGKTGSAYIPNPAGGGYLNELTDSYIGFGPTSDPRFIAFIRLNTIPVTSLAAETVVPAWNQLAQWIVNYYNIPPDRTTQDVIPNCPDLICS
ncbi:MAG TPA: penicillin-binding protein 2 [Candidatus Paceibacterota bacterium]|nr:penicillin-binding protein 2 [Candidatus Paceibacterota bacterium]